MNLLLRSTLVLSDIIGQAASRELRAVNKIQRLVARS